MRAIRARGEKVSMSGWGFGDLANMNSNKCRFDDLDLRDIR